MLNKIIKFALQQRLLVMALSIVLMIAGTWQAINLPVDVTKILDCVGFDPTTVEKIVFESGRELAFVSRALISLELEEIVSKVPGGYVKLVSH